MNQESRIKNYRRNNKNSLFILYTSHREASPSTTFTKSSAGFTLIEMLLVVSAISIIMGIGAPVYQRFQNRNYLDIATVTTVQSFRRAQVLAQSVHSDASWGVLLQSSSITLFQGNSYVTRNSSFDEVFEMPSNITLSGITEIIFTKFTGVPQITGSLTLTSIDNETRTITVNTKGMASY